MAAPYKGGACDVVRELYGRLEAARLELNALRDAGGRISHDVNPDWLLKLGWTSSLMDPRD